MDKLTERQFQILHVVKSFVERNGFPPTIMEIGRQVGLENGSVVRKHLLALEKKGYIRKDKDRSRAIRIVRQPPGRAGDGSIPAGHTCREAQTVYFLEYHLALATRGSRRLLMGMVREQVRLAMEQEARTHGWDLVDVSLQPDHVLVRIRLGPSVSPSQALEALKLAANEAWRQHPLGIPDKGLWASGGIVTTDASARDLALQEFLEGLSA